MAKFVIKVFIDIIFSRLYTFLQKKTISNSVFFYSEPETKIFHNTAQYTADRKFIKQAVHKRILQHVILRDLLAETVSRIFIQS